MEWIAEQARHAVEKAMSSLGWPATQVVMMKPPQPEFGELSTNAAFILAKPLAGRPYELADRLIKAMQLPELFDRAENRNGYINFFLNWKKVAKALADDPELAVRIPRRTGRVIVEYPSVNPGKPWHVGHGRNAVLGDTISRLMKFAGYEVIRQDYIDDLGLQVAQVLWGVMNLDNLPPRQGLLKKEDQWQGRVYVKVAKQMSAIENQIRDIMKKMEEGDESIREKHHETVDRCVKAQYETAFRLGIYHDVKVHESAIVRSGLFEAGFSLLRKSPRIVFEQEGKNRGCWVAKLSDLPEFSGMTDADKVLIRSDGTATYTGKDVVYHMWKFGILEDSMKYSLWMVQPDGEEMWTTSEEGEKKVFNHADMIINVIGSEQAYPQKVVKNILRLMGYEKQSENYFHLAYEHVWFKERGESLKFSGRKGTWIGYSVDEVLNRIKEMAKQRMAGRDLVDMDGVAEKIAVGAFRYAMISTDWARKVAFDFNEILNFEGNTAPYLQYSDVRAKKVIEKSGLAPSFVEPQEISEKERELLKKIMESSDWINRAVNEKKPHLISNHAFKLADAFNSFYQSERIIGSEKQGFRLWLTQLFVRTLETLMELMGVPVQDEM